MPRCFNAVAACQLPLKSLTDYAFERILNIQSLNELTYEKPLCVESNLSSPNRILQQGLSARHRPNIAVLHTVVQALTSLGGCRGAWCLESCGLTTPPFYEPKELA
jgi:hypothetical protein